MNTRRTTDAAGKSWRKWGNDPDPVQLQYLPPPGPVATGSWVTPWVILFWIICMDLGGALALVVMG